MTQNKVILIGFVQATVLAEIKYFIEEDSNITVEILDPEIFLSKGSDHNIPHMIAVTRDLNLRQQLINKLEADQYKKFTFIHTTVITTTNAKVGEGTFIGPFSMIASNATIGPDCIIAPYCLVSHKSTIGQGTVLNSAAIVAGSTNIGKYCKLNMRSSIIDFLEVGNFVEVGAGSMLTKNTPDQGVYVGTPARKKINAGS